MKQVIQVYTVEEKIPQLILEQLQQGLGEVSIRTVRCKDGEIPAPEEEKSDKPSKNFDFYFFDRALITVENFSLIKAINAAKKPLFSTRQADKEVIEVTDIKVSLMGKALNQQNPADMRIAFRQAQE